MRVRIWICCITLLLMAGMAQAKEAGSEEEAKLLGGMSIVGNDEAPKSLVIVPWKESRVGESLDFSSTLGEGLDPVDKDVFARALDYYQIRVGAK